MTRMIKFKPLDPRAILPEWAYSDDLGCDFAIIGDHTLNPGESRDLPSGLAAEPPPGYGLRITGRSSTLRSLGLRVNEGIIDGGYRGELKTYVTNENAVKVEVKHGTRLAQLIPAPIIRCDTGFYDELAPSARGAKGFGSTGAAGSPFTEAAAVDEFLVYLGGPIDYANPDADLWRHTSLWIPSELTPWANVNLFCPACEGKGKEPGVIMEQNRRALSRARISVFDLRGDQFSVGTPIEAWEKTADFGFLPRPRGVILVHPAEPGLFVREMAVRGATVVGSFVEARLHVRDLLKQAAW